jgi:hypothetical protein
VEAKENGNETCKSGQQGWEPHVIEIIRPITVGNWGYENHKLLKIEDHFQFSWTPLFLSLSSFFQSHLHFPFN